MLKLFSMRYDLGCGEKIIILFAMVVWVWFAEFKRAPHSCGNSNQQVDSCSGRAQTKRQKRNLFSDYQTAFKGPPLKQYHLSEFWRWPSISIERKWTNRAFTCLQAEFFMGFTQAVISFFRWNTKLTKLGKNRSTALRNRIISQALYNRFQRAHVKFWYCHFA